MAHVAGTRARVISPPAVFFSVKSTLSEHILIKIVCNSIFEGHITFTLPAAVLPQTCVYVEIYCHLKIHEAQLKDLLVQTPSRITMHRPSDWVALIKVEMGYRRIQVTRSQCNVAVRR